jgi:LacI family transcriptional regulator
MTSLTHPKKIALIGFPILEMRSNPTAHALARYILEEKQWEIALAAKAGVGGIRLAEKMGCDGALVRLLNTEMTREARSAGIPLVNVSGWLNSTGIATVKCDNVAIGRLAAKHLHEQNFKRFAVIVAPGGVLNKERCRGFLEHAASLDLRTECFRCKKNTPTDGGVDWDSLSGWLSGLKKPTGLFLTDDILAQGLLKSMQGCGISVPHDVGLVCGPIHPDRGGLCSPILSTIDPDTARVYRVALDSLEKMMTTQENVTPSVKLISPAGLCPGDSTRLTASDDPLVARAIRIMDAEKTQGLNINLLCSQLGITCATLERHFKSTLGVSPHHYLTGLRITAAKKQLANNQDSIDKIARACGFSNRKRLNLIFAAKEGISPRQWRTQSITR